MRSKWKGIFIHTIIYKFSLNKSAANFSQTWLNQKINIRSSVFIKELWGRSLFVHNGKTFIRIKFFTFKMKNVKIGQFTYNRILPDQSLYSDNRRLANLRLAFQRGQIRRKTIKYNKEMEG